MFWTFEANGRQFEVELRGANLEHIWIGGVAQGEIAWSRGADGHLFLQIDGRNVHAVVMPAARGWQIWIKGEIYLLERFDGRRALQASTSENRLEANLPGQIVEILVKPGDQVEQGQTLLVLEAMKMETRLRAPHDGRVVAIHCTVGQQVERGARLLELDENLNTD